MVTAAKPKLPSYEESLDFVRLSMSSCTDAELEEMAKFYSDAGESKKCFCIMHELHLREMERVNHGTSC